MLLNLYPYGEPQLGRRGLYPNVNSKDTWNISNDNEFDDRSLLNILLTVLSMADGETYVNEMSDSLGLAERRSHS